MRRPSTTTADTATARLQTGPRLLDAGASDCLLPLPFRLAIRAVLWLISDSLPLWPARVDGVGETEEFSPRLVLLRGRKESLCSIERPRYYTTHSAEAEGKCAEHNHRAVEPMFFHSHHRSFPIRSSFCRSWCDPSIRWMILPPDSHDIHTQG